MNNQAPRELWKGKGTLFPVVEVKRVNQEMKNSVTQKIRAFQRMQNKVTPLTPAQRFLAFPGPQRTRHRPVPASRTLPLRPAKQPDESKIHLKVLGSSMGLFNRKNSLTSSKRSQKSTKAIPETPPPGDEGGPAQQESLSQEPPGRNSSPEDTTEVPFPMESNLNSPAGSSTSDPDPISS
ncbi:hypothetical protein AAFF_G00397480 [Aldrovandia affinis]|uniref:Uncharacterized protein n=1 Tax=Aldrovandia affinis TaxID=143900 RepID=A0AAD7WKU4_9TELE|nr:hypothetical protein AAFF_G00397480 [Aldrovandia affinis]